MALVQETDTKVEPPTPVKRWPLPTKLAFRFLFIYFLLFSQPITLIWSIARQVLGFMQNPSGPFSSIVGVVAQFVEIPRVLVLFVAERVFGAELPLVVTGTGSGDRTYDWARAFCVLVLAVAATTLWSILDRKRDNYIRLNRWFRLLLRFWLGYTMVGYGVIKVIPVQMPEPLLSRLLQPFGNFSPMGILWTSIGASPAYERFIGGVEILGGALLFLPQAVVLGALISLAAAIQIFVLNMTYDIPVKLFSFHLILFSIILLGPDARRLVNVVLLNRPTNPSTQQPFGRTPGRRRAATGAQLGVGVLITALAVFNALSAWNRYGGGRPVPPLHGVWNVEEMAINDVARAPLVTDYERWRRVIFEKGGFIVTQSMNESFTYHGGSVDTHAGIIVLTYSPNGLQVGRFNYVQPTPEELTLDGNLLGRRITARLRRVAPERFLLRNRGFHWIQEYPYNR